MTDNRTEALNDPASADKRVEADETIKTALNLVERMRSSLRSQGGYGSLHNITVMDIDAVLALAIRDEKNRAALAAADTISPPSDPARDKAMMERGAERMRERGAEVAEEEALHCLEIKHPGHGASRRIAEAIRALDLTETEK